MESAPSPSARARAPILKLALPFYGIVTLFAVGYAVFSNQLGTLLGDGPLELKSLAAAAGFALVLVALSRVGARAWKPMERASRAGAALLGPLGLGEALALAALSGVAEELLFRGALWPQLRLWGTTLLFGLVHVVPRRSLWVYPLFATAAGLVMGLLRQGSQHVAPAMLAHAVVNGFNLVWLARLARREAAAAPSAAGPDPGAPPALGPVLEAPPPAQAAPPVPRADLDPPA